MKARTQSIFVFIIPQSLLNKFNVGNYLNFGVPTGKSHFEEKKQNKKRHLKKKLPRNSEV